MPRPIFIVGAPRSGTSVLTWALGQHPNIALLPETNWFPALAAGAHEAFKLGSSRGEFSHLSNARMPYDVFMAFLGDAADRIALDAFRRRVARFPSGDRTRTEPAQRTNPLRPALIHAPADPKTRWVDGTPDNTFSVYALSLLFPDARFIHLLRRPEAVAHSLAHFENAGVDGRNVDPAKGLETWITHVRAAAEAERALGRAKVLRLLNEDLRSDGEAALVRCFAFLEEEMDQRALLPLDRQVNSSRPPEDVAATLHRIKATPLFAEADALHASLATAAIEEAPDQAALAAMRGRFEAPATLFKGLAEPLKRFVRRHR